jgi:hypothetical protein
MPIDIIHGFWNKALKWHNIAFVPEFSMMPVHKLPAAWT